MTTENSHNILKEVLLKQEPFELKSNKDILSIIPDIEVYFKKEQNFLKDSLKEHLSLFIKTKKPKSYLEKLMMDDRTELISWLELHFKF